MNIAVIGAGFAGLSSALLLSEKGYKITVYEKFKELKMVGAGLMIQPSSMFVLKKLGLYEEVLKHGERVDRIIGLNHKKKQVFATYYKDYEKNSFGIGIHRACLYEIILKACQQKENIHFVLNSDITDIQSFKESHDLVIVANGSHSQLRKQLPITQSYKPYPYGCVWTTIYDEKTTLYKLQQYVRNSTEMFGLLPSGRKDGKRLLSVFWSLPVSQKNSYSKENIILAMQKHHKDPTLLGKIKASDFAFAVYADIRMEKYHYKNIVIIGDAAHGMSPQLGQGANMAFLDSYFLSEVLDSNDIDNSLEKYSSIRKEHLKFYGDASKFLTPLFQSQYKIFGRVRDIMFTISQGFSFSRRMSSQILAGTRVGWFSKKRIEYNVKK